MDINAVPMVRITWLDARDTETGWIDIKDIIRPMYSSKPIIREWIDKITKIS